MSTTVLINKRIFVVEDNAGNLAVIRTVLEQYRVVVGYDRWGVNTLSQLEQFSPVDMILLDLMFPHGVTGYDVFTAIRSVPSYANVPIVAVSAGDPIEAVHRTKAHGFAGFIAKPIHFVHFGPQLADIFESKPVWDYGQTNVVKKG